MTIYQKIMRLIETSGKGNAKEKIYDFIAKEPRSSYMQNSDRYLLYTPLYSKGMEIGAVILQAKMESGSYKISIHGASVFEGIKKSHCDYDFDFDDFILALFHAFDA